MMATESKKRKAKDLKCGVSVRIIGTTRLELNGLVGVILHRKRCTEDCSAKRCEDCMLKGRYCVKHVDKDRKKYWQKMFRRKNLELVSEENMLKKFSGTKEIRCGNCNKLQPKKKRIFCSRCKVVSYCNGDCQKADWSKHKLICTSLRGILQTTSKRKTQILSPVEYQLYGKALLATNQKEHAFTAFRESLNRDPFNPQVLFNLVDALSDHGQFLLAITELNKSIDLFKERGGAQYEILSLLDKKIDIVTKYIIPNDKGESDETENIPFKEHLYIDLFLIAQACQEPFEYSEKRRRKWLNRLFRCVKRTYPKDLDRIICVRLEIARIFPSEPLSWSYLGYYLYLEAIGYYFKGYRDGDIIPTAKKKEFRDKIESALVAFDNAVEIGENDFTSYFLRTRLKFVASAFEDGEEMLNHLIEKSSDEEEVQKLKSWYDSVKSDPKFGHSSFDFNKYLVLLVKMIDDRGLWGFCECCLNNPDKPDDDNSMVCSEDPGSKEEEIKKEFYNMMHGERTEDLETAFKFAQEKFGVGRSIVPGSKEEEARKDFLKMFHGTFESDDLESFFEFAKEKWGVGRSVVPGSKEDEARKEFFKLLERTFDTKEEIAAFFKINKENLGM